MAFLLAQQAYPGLPGFLGTRGSLMLDVVFLAMFLVVPAMGLSIYLVKYKQLYSLHKTIQITLATVLLIAVLAFEVDMQFLSGWTKRAEPSPYWSDGAAFGPVRTALKIHLCFAVPTLFLWILVIVQALRKFPTPPVPGKHSAAHRSWGWLAAIGMTMTAVTGWIFYWLAFVA